MLRSMVKTAVAALVAWAAAKGIEIDEGSLVIVATGIAAGVLNLLSSWASRRWPWIARLWPVPAYDTTKLDA